MIQWTIALGANHFKHNILLDVGVATSVEFVNPFCKYREVFDDVLRVSWRIHTNGGFKVCVWQAGWQIYYINKNQHPRNIPLHNLFRPYETHQANVGFKPRTLCHWPKSVPLDHSDSTVKWFLSMNSNNNNKIMKMGIPTMTYYRSCRGYPYPKSFSSKIALKDSFTRHKEIVEERCTVYSRRLLKY